MDSSAGPGGAARLAVRAFFTLAAALVLPGCNRLELGAAEQAAPLSTPGKPAEAIQAPPGFRVELHAQGFNFPSAMDWDDRGRLHVLESHSVPLPLTGIRILRVEPGKDPTEVELTGDQAPSGATAVGLVFHEGWFYLSHEEKDSSWGISRFRPDAGAVEAVLRGIPSAGDHWVNHLAFDREGALWFGVGSATNSGVVSSHDPVNLKWLEKRRHVRDIPCRDLVLRATAFEEEDALTDEAGDRARTGAYQAYGRATGKLGTRRLKGEPLCTSALYRLPRGADRPVLVAWGFRNPVGVAIDAEGEVFVAAQGADVRGTRPVLDDPDAIYRVRDGAWYGWPEFAGDFEPWTAARFQVDAAHSAAGRPGPEPVLDLGASGLRRPSRRLLVAATAPHAAVCGMTVVPPTGPFAGWAGQLLVAEMGDFRPTTDAIRPDVRAGFQVEAIDPRTGEAWVFLRNRGEGPSQPASALDLADGLERPVDVRIGPDGLVYVLDFGVWVPTEDAARVLPKTGKVFRVVPADTPR